MKPRKFNHNEAVQRINQPDAIGIVLDAHWNEQADIWIYTVQFGGTTRGVPEDGLILFKRIQTIWEALEGRSFSGYNHFLSILTFHRLKKPPSRIANSFATAKTDFYPYQFKPLLKFLDHPGKRILIADEVGLGKTIEAGYILKELQAHQIVERVLVLVPSRLRKKWKKELKERFDESFELINGNDLVLAAERIKKGKEPEPFKWIVSYESARTTAIRQALEETQIPIDILIADEAHWMRNTETQQHKVGNALCRCSDICVFLSATPVHNNFSDLFQLFRLLSPEEFSEWEVFQNQIKSNALIFKVHNVLREAPPNYDKAHDLLEKYRSSYHSDMLLESEFYKSIIQRIDEKVVDRKGLIELQRDISHLSPIGHILTRTKKTEALEYSPKREANWIPINLTPTEAKIYNSVESLCKITGLGGESNWGFQMSLLTAYRITASCLPASLDYFKEKLEQNDDSTISDELEEYAEDDNTKAEESSSIWKGASRKHFENISEMYQELNGVDTKYQTLQEALYGIWEEDKKAKKTNRKVVIFSYFPRTLNYLAKRLTRNGISNVKIHGKVKVRDREALIDDFLDSDDIQVLLTSDVGGEGIDLQKASVLINYDLPWNPMVVEQRIGRIDRIGQKSPRIVIINLIVKNSVEEKVLQRLLNKIEIFRMSIGEPDPIIGEEIERLTSKALRGEFSEDELERELQRQGDALEKQIHEARNMLTQVDKLLAADQSLIDEINSLIGERQIPSEDEVLIFLNKYLAKNYSGIQIPKAATDKVVKVDLRGQLAIDIENASTEIEGNVAYFARKIQNGPVEITLSRTVGYRHPQTETIHFKHPLVQYAVKEFDKSDESIQAAFSLALRRGSKELKNGLYGFVIVFLEIESRRPNRKMLSIFLYINSNEIIEDQDITLPLTLSMLKDGEDISPPNLDHDKIQSIKQSLVKNLIRVKNDIDTREYMLDKARKEQQKLALQATLELRVRRAQERMNTLTENQASEFPMRMAESKLKKAKEELSNTLKSFDIPINWKSIEYEEIAVGFLQVENS